MKNLKLNTNNKQIITITAAIAVSILVPQINFMTNNVFLSRLGEKFLAVGGITGVYYLIFALIGYGLTQGLQALISRRAGENRIDEISKLFSHGVAISLIMALAGILFTYSAAPSLLRYAIHNSETQELAIKFLKIRIWGLPFLYVYQMRNALLIGTNNSKYLIFATLAETITNIILDYGLIFGNIGLPLMGFNGAAVASIIAEAFGMLAVFLVIHFYGLGKKFKLFESWKIDIKTSLLILDQSAPLVFQYSISIISWEFFYILIEHHGTLDLAVSNAMRNIFGLFGCVSWAFASTTNTMVSNIIGQGLEDIVPKLINRIMFLSAGFALFICIILNMFPHAFLAIYGQDETFIQHAIPTLRIVSTALVAMAVATVWLNAVVGAGFSKVNLMIELVAIVLYCTYVWYILEYKNYSINIGWLSEWIYWLTLFSLSFLFMRSGKWKGKKI